MIDSRYITGFAFGAGAVFLIFLFSGVLDEITLTGIREWLSATSGWIAAAGALIIGLPTVRYLGNQVELSVIEAQLREAREVKETIDRFYQALPIWFANVSSKQIDAATFLRSYDQLFRTHFTSIAPDFRTNALRELFQAPVERHFKHQEPDFTALEKVIATPKQRDEFYNDIRKRIADSETEMTKGYEKARQRREDLRPQYFKTWL